MIPILTTTEARPRDERRKHRSGLALYRFRIECSSGVFAAGAYTETV
jgi:hypothetical protein